VVTLENGKSTSDVDQIQFGACLLLRSILRSIA
jgi:hypothetical protein